MTRDSFVFYKSFYEAVNHLNDADRLACYDAIAKYGLEGVCDAEGVPAAIMSIVRPILDANNRRYENGKQGGRKPNQNQTETKPEPNPNQTETKGEPNVKCKMLNENVKEKRKTEQKEKAFVKPTAEEVREYCRERGNNVDPEAFVAYYESKGWKVGNQPMKNWKAAIVTWEKRDKQQPRAKPPDKWHPQNQRTYDYDELERRLLAQA